MTKTKRQANSMMGLPIPEYDKPAVLAPSDSRPRQSPSALWAAVSRDDIGEGFVAVETFDREKPRKSRSFFEVKEFQNKFVSGHSPFVIYEVTPRLVKSKAANKVKKPFNSHTKVSKSERLKFAQSLEKNISSVTTLFLTEILPVTLSIRSAVEDVKEKMSQLVGEPIDVPADFYYVKAMQALQLRVVRQLCEDFKLTPEESNLMVAEFLPRLPKETKKEK